MEFLEKLIPLAVLLGVAAFLVVLLRRVTRENTGVEPRREIAVKPKPAATAAIVVVQKVHRTVATSPAPIQIKATAPPPKLPKRAKPTPAVPATPTKTPIHGVLDLLQEKDALATAFLLGEILGPPVSKRK